MDAVIEHTTPQDTNQLHDNHVKGEDVRVACQGCRGNRTLLPPSFAASVEDEEDERQEEDVVGDKVGCIDRKTASIYEAVILQGVERGIGGRIDRHVCLFVCLDE